MGRVSGRAFLMRVEDSEGSGTYSKLGSQTNLSWQINNAPVEDTTKDTAVNLRSYAGAETISEFTASIEGVIDDGSASQLRFRDESLFTGQKEINGQILNGGTNGYFSGRFVIENYQESGPVGDVVRFTASIRNQGDLSYTPGAQPA